MRFLGNIFLTLVSLGLITLIAAVGVGVYAVTYFSQDLPDYKSLQTYQPPEVTRIYAGDGHLLAEFAAQRRIFVPLAAIPPIVRESFLSAEDKNFYHHSGVDFTAIARAAYIDFRYRGERRPEGASTITQQVAKNMLVGNERSLRRKIREAIIAFRMERVLTKDQILEIYLNEIYLGDGAYGVAAAAQTYFNKPLADLTVPEAAFLAILPKAPGNYDPTHHHDAAIERRNWVIGQLQQNKYITAADAQVAQGTPLVTAPHEENTVIAAPYFGEEVRRQLSAKYGDSALYAGGLSVRTSLDPHLQDIAERSLRLGLQLYDRRHGWRGPINHIERTSGWQAQLAAMMPPKSMLDSWQFGIVLHVTGQDATVGLKDGSEIKLLLKDLAWCVRQSVPVVTSVDQVLHAGDVIMVEPDQAEDDKGAVRKFWQLRQIPRVNGALMAMDPHTGRVLAMQGGWSFKESVFNRATQAWRQPGSSFKPFVYITALEHGFTPATQVLDAPMVLSQGAGMPMWAPKNYKNEQLGIVPLRIGIEKSLNLVTIRVANQIGMPNVAKTAEDFGVVNKMEPNLANAIGAQVTTIWRQVTAYAQFVNGGKKITPTLIDRIEDRSGKTIYNHDVRACADCGPLVPWQNQAVPQVPDPRPQIVDPRYAYQIVSMLEGVVQRGTGEAIKELGRPLAGKTGTTNDSKDVWFIGFSPDLVCGVYIGYDQPKTLGKHETGATVSVPVFYNFMKEALNGVPPTPFRVPPGIREVLINRRTGAQAEPGDTDVIWEAFTEGTEPDDQPQMRLDGSGFHPISGGGGEVMNDTGVDGDDSGGATPATHDAYGYTGNFNGTNGNDSGDEPAPSHDTDSAPAMPPADTGATQGTGGLY